MWEFYSFASVIASLQSGTGRQVLQRSGANIKRGRSYQMGSERREYVRVITNGIEISLQKKMYRPVTYEIREIYEC